ncbi:MAG: WYL domain-containing protein [Eubacteriales bacterium]|nr:WYL domain-containing protein [Eubacteriales bacterium]
MARSNNQKGKILYLERLLQGTGEGRAVSMQEILAELSAYGIVAERKSIYDDLDVLRSFGMDIRYRRGKPGGYYLAGNEAAVPSGGRIPENRGEEAPGDEEEKQPPREKKPSPLAFWELESGEGKELRLICRKEREKELRALFGGSAQFKEKGSGFLMVSLRLREGPAFYGWLAAMGKDVHIQKPKKAALAYREYLKEIVRDYKGI